MRLSSFDFWQRTKRAWVTFAKDLLQHLNRVTLHYHLARFKVKAALEISINFDNKNCAELLRGIYQAEVRHEVNDATESTSRPWWVTWCRLEERIDFHGRVDWWSRNWFFFVEIVFLDCLHHPFSRSPTTTPHPYWCWKILPHAVDIPGRFRI